MLNRLAHTEHKYQGLIRTLALSWNHLSPTNRSHQSFPGNSDSERNRFTYFTMWHQKKPDVCVVTCNIICKKNFFYIPAKTACFENRQAYHFYSFSVKAIVLCQLSSVLEQAMQKQGCAPGGSNALLLNSSCAPFIHQSNSSETWRK